MESLKIVLLLASVLCGHMAACWDQDLRNLVLKIHNDYRRGVSPAACQMEEMVYNMTLEKQAESWAKKCVFEHDMHPNRGENLAFMTYGSKTEVDMMKNRTKAWYNEVNDYTYGQNSCDQSCHYTQMVAAKTDQVGCYAYKCPMLSPVRAADAWYLVCYYTPFGNWMGEPPYQTKCDTPCVKGQKLVNGLCEAGSAGGSDENAGSPTGGDQEKEQGGNANSGESENQGNTNESGSENQGNTNESGNENKGATNEGGNENEEKTNGGSSANGECKDTTVNCKYWKSQCKSNPLTLNHYCPATCGTCGKKAGEGNQNDQGKSDEGYQNDQGTSEENQGANECKDKSEGCAYWASIKQCETNPKTMAFYCPKSCGVCIASP